MRSIETQRVETIRMADFFTDKKWCCSKDTWGIYYDPLLPENSDGISLVVQEISNQENNQ